ncbi:BON domain-containing protein [Pseudomonas sp. LRF_L74]|uniref:BON domain-containing protein n=1 Tax=Pseudomonas sp. LRF_L74 TaxID=3369422 RepID=UPI003F5D572C
MSPIKALSFALVAAGLSNLVPALAADSVLDDARREGAIDTAFTLNRHLSPYALSATVEQGHARLEGRVENPVEKDLAGQIASGVEGVSRVDNRLQVDPSVQPPHSEKPALAQRFDDATLSATVKSQLAWNTGTQRLEAEVKSRDGVVTLNGDAHDPVTKELAGKVAENTDGVRRVNNYLSVSVADSTRVQVQNASRDEEAEISDGWITSKVRSSFIYSRNLDAQGIVVETRDGLVRLSGSVLSEAERQLAIEIASNIRGVRAVEANALRAIS